MLRGCTGSRASLPTPASAMSERSSPAVASGSTFRLHLRLSGHRPAHASDNLPSSLLSDGPLLGGRTAGAGIDEACRGQLHWNELQRRGAGRDLALCRAHNLPGRRQTRTLEPSADEPLANKVDVQAVRQRHGRHRRARPRHAASTWALNSAPCARRCELGCIGAHLFRLVGTIVTIPSGASKVGRLAAHASAAEGQQL